MAKVTPYAYIQPPIVGGELLWAKAKYNWSNQSGNGSYVECNPCADHEGANADTGVAIRIYLPRATDTDPNVVAGQVIGYSKAANGISVAATGYLDDAIGTIKMWSKNTGDPPDGWSECDGNGTGTILGLEGTFPVAKKSGDTDFGTVGDTGNLGVKTHCHAIVRDDPYPPCANTWIDEGQYESTSLSINTANHLPPWCVVRFIERIDNSC